TSLAIAGGLFVFNERVVVNANRQVTAWSDNDYKPVPPDTGNLSNVWLLSGNDLIQARHVGGRGKTFHVEDLTIYDREGGELQQIIKAERADPQGNAWKLGKVSIYNSSMSMVRHLPELTALEGVQPEQLTIAKVDPDQLDFWTLKARIAQLERAGRPTDEAKAGLWHKVSGPLSTLLMPLLAATAAFGLARSGQVLLRACIGMALGFAYFVADNFSIAMGNVGAYPPFLAAWAPFMLFLLVGEAVLIRSEE
ncbi:MAG TPA: LptF/LptG family permease, partial [Sphingomicrobium sp.]|nr:LptF/LptG family permease [Sphingomicrobium sp.]